MELKACPRCNRPFLARAEVCPRCGDDVPEWDQESWVNVGCLLLMVGLALLMIVLPLLAILSAFTRLF